MSGDIDSPPPACGTAASATTSPDLAGLVLPGNAALPRLVRHLSDMDIERCDAAAALSVVALCGHAIALVSDARASALARIAAVSGPAPPAAAAARRRTRRAGSARRRRAARRAGRR